MISKTKKNQKKIVIFIPSIEGGGVEKNLFIISNFLSKKYFKVYVSTSSFNMKSRFDKEISFILPNSKQWQKKGRFFKTLVCLWNLFLFWLDNKNFMILSFQANIYSILFGYVFNIKVVSRSNSAPQGWSQNIFKRAIFKIILKLANTVIVNSYDFKKHLDNDFNVNSVCIYNPLDRKNIDKLSKKKLNLNGLIIQKLSLLMLQDLLIKKII